MVRTSAEELSIKTETYATDSLTLKEARAPLEHNLPEARKTVVADIVKSELD